MEEEHVEKASSEAEDLLCKIAAGEVGHVGQRIGFKMQIRQYEPVEATVWGQVSCSKDTMEQHQKDLNEFLDKALGVIWEKVEEYKQEILKKQSL